MQPVENEDSSRPLPIGMLPVRRRRRRRPGQDGCEGDRAGDEAVSAAGAACIAAMPPGLLALALLLLWAAATVQTCQAFQQLPALGFGGGLSSVRDANERAYE